MAADAFGERSLPAVLSSEGISEHGTGVTSPARSHPCKGHSIEGAQDISARSVQLHATEGD